MPHGKGEGGALAGMTAFGVYAVFECLFLSLVSWAALPAGAYEPEHWGFTLLMFAVALSAGAAMGAIGGPLVATLVLVAAAGANLLRHLGSGLGLVPALLTCGTLAAALALSLGSPRWRQRLAGITGPWTVGALLAGMIWIGKDSPFSSLRAKVVVTVLYAAAVLLLARALPAGRRLGIGFALAVLVLSGLPKQQPLLSPRAGPQPAPPARAPNVLLVTMDTVRADHLSVYGYSRDTTPSLRRFATEATLFRNAISTSDITLSSHASIFTGLAARMHGAHMTATSEAGNGLAPRFRTMAEILLDAGYATAAVVANRAMLTHDYGMDQGFEDTRQVKPVTFFYGAKPYYLRQMLRDVLSRFAPPWQAQRRLSTAGDINREAFAALERTCGAGRPWFLFLNYMDAHQPYAPPPPFSNLFPGSGEGDPRRDYMAEYDQILAGRRSLSENERRYLISQYDGGIAYEDRCLGLLLAHLRDIGAYENTLIIITSDHGEAFGEKGFVSHGVSVYQDQVRVPLLIKYPGSRAAAVVEDLVSGVDLLPTVLSAASLPVPPGLPGSDLRATTPPAGRTVISESYPSRRLCRLNPQLCRVERALFSGAEKLIVSSAGKRELYDTARDPGEQNNLYGTAAGPLETALAGWLRHTPDGMGRAADLTAESVNSLKSLGYLQ